MAQELLLKALGQLVIFHGLKEAELQELAAAITLHKSAPGTLICREGDPGDALYLILKGRVAVEKRGSGGPGSRSRSSAPGTLSERCA